MIDPQEIPRFAGVSTFMRQPHTYELEETQADIAILGVPFDDATTYRPGARFGPQAVRNASTLLKPYNPVLDVDLTTVDIVDHDDAPVIPGYVQDTFEEIEERVGYVLDHNMLPAMIGGDHSISLPILRAIAAEYGSVSLVQFDAHSDLWPEYFGKEYNHGTSMHHAVEEDLIDPTTSIRIGDRGGLYSPDDIDMMEEAGIEYYTADRVPSIGIESLGDMIHERVEPPVYVTIDIDAVDPAYAPGTGTPMPGGLTSREILGLTRQLAGLDIVGFDLVEVSPPYDTGQQTAILAANIIFEALCATISPTK